MLCEQRQGFALRRTYVVVIRVVGTLFLEPH